MACCGLYFRHILLCHLGLSFEDNGEILNCNLQDMTMFRLLVLCLRGLFVIVYFVEWLI